MQREKLVWNSSKEEEQRMKREIIDASKCCLEMYRRYVNSSIAYILVSVCPADGITSYCPIWVDTIKK